MKNILVLAVTFALIFGLSMVSPYRQQSKVPVQLIRPTVMDICDTTLLQGTVVDGSPVRVYPTGTSTVQEILVRPGDVIQAGDPLLRLSRLDDTPGSQDLAAAFSQLEAAAKAGEYDAVQTMLDSMKTPDFSSEIQKVHFLYSPVSGIVLDVFCTIGETVSSMVPCAEICDPNNLVIRAEVEETIIGELREDMLCKVSVPAFSLSDISATVTGIEPFARKTSFLTSMDTAKTTVEITPASVNGLLPGYRAEARVITDYSKDALLLPYEAIQQDDLDREYVMVLEDNRIVKRIIFTGSELEEQVEILTGITEDTLVVVDPLSVSAGEVVCLE